jgi:branched-chain amino acid transport system substrate-binding protein
MRLTSGRYGLLYCAIAVLLMIVSSAHAENGKVTIGVLSDMSSVYADNEGPGGVVAVKMAIEDFGGKVLGAPIDLITADHQNKPDIGVSIAREWYDSRHVDAIVGLGNSAVGLAVQGVARERGKITLISGSATSGLTGAQCSPTGMQWTIDTYALAKGAVSAFSEEEEKTWFLLTADYAFGKALEADVVHHLTASGGKLLGSVRHPLNSSDLSSFLLQAQSSGAQVIGFANAGGDTINSIKQAREFGLGNSARLAALFLMVTDVHSIGLEAAQGLRTAEAFYWDQDDETRAFSRRFMARHPSAPTQLQAGMYSATFHYLKAVQAAGTDEPKAVVAKMREMPINDFMTHGGKVRVDGRIIRDIYVLQVKAPVESRGPWDLMRVIKRIPGEEAFRPISESECPYVKKSN